MGLEYGTTTILRSIHVVEQLSLFFLSILTFNFDLIFGSFTTFGGPDGLFLGLRKSLKTVLGSTHVVEQQSFSMFSLILTFDFDLILGSFLTFLGPNGLFWGRVRVQTVLGSPQID